MRKRLDISDDERREASRRIRNFFLFTEDVLADPSILEGMPDESKIEPVPIAERDPALHYDIETSRTVVTVTGVHRENSAHRKPA
jgi:hypothetical protein